VETESYKQKRKLELKKKLNRIFPSMEKNQNPHGNKEKANPK
jgi:hypothetical protein